MNRVTAARQVVVLTAVLGVALGAAACGGATDGTPTAAFEDSVEGEGMALEVSSLVFEDQSPIPVDYTCDGDNVSPPIAWSGAPSDVRSFALICDDPDAPMGTWVHWVVYDIPSDETELPEAVPDLRELPSGAHHGRNDFKNLGYGGPCPPAGNPHRYFFKLYALDKMLQLEPGATKQEVREAMEGHVLDQAELVGTYQRQ